MFEALKPELMEVARRNGLDDQGADDVVQETFLGVIKAEDRFESGRPFLPWVRGIALRQVRAERRRRARLQMFFHSAASGPEEGKPDSSSLDASELREEVQRALRSLSESNRLVVHAALFEGLSSDELSERLGLTKSAAAVRLHRGLIQLRAKLGRRFNLALLGAIPERWHRTAMKAGKALSVKAVVLSAVAASLAVVGIGLALSDSSRPRPVEPAQADGLVGRAPLHLKEEQPEIGTLASKKPAVEAASDASDQPVESAAAEVIPAVQIQGVVLESSGAPAPAGVEVFVLQTTPALVLPTAPLRPVATTDASGRFVLAPSALGGDPTPLLMVRYGSQVGWTDVSVADIAGSAFPPISLTPETRIVARVVDVNGLPLEGASLAGFTQIQRFMAPLEEMSRQFGFLAIKPYRHLFGATSDDQGRASITSLFGSEAPSLIFFLSVSKEGYATAMQAIQGPGEQHIGTDVILRRLDSLSFTGQVVDEDGAPLPDATSRFMVRGEAPLGDSAQVQIEPTAEWSVPSAQLDEYPLVVRFECAGYCAEEIAIEQSDYLSGEPYVVSLTRESPLRVQVRSQAGDLLAGAELALVTAGAIRSVATDENGSHEFRGLRESSRRVAVRYGDKGEEQQSVAVSIGPSESGVTVVLPQIAHRIPRLEVTASDDADWKFADLRAFDVDGFAGSLAPVQLAGGSAYFEAIPEGLWTFSGMTVSGEPYIEMIQLPREAGAGAASLEAQSVLTGMATCLVSPSANPASPPLNLDGCNVVLRRTDLPGLPRWLQAGRRPANTVLHQADDPKSVMSFSDLAVGQWSLCVLGTGWASAPMLFEVKADEVTRIDVEPVPSGTMSFVRPAVVSSGLARFEIRRDSSQEWQLLNLMPFGHDWPEPSDVIAPEGVWQWRATLVALNSQDNLTDIFPPTYGVAKVTRNSTTTIKMSTAAITAPE